MKPPRKLDALTGPPELLEKVGGSAGAVATVTSPDWLEDNAAIMPWIVFAFAFFSRFWRLDQPRGVVFDEVRMGGGVAPSHAACVLTSALALTPPTPLPPRRTLGGSRTSTRRGSTTCVQPPACGGAAPRFSRRWLTPPPPLPV